MLTCDVHRLEGVLGWAPWVSWNSYAALEAKREWKMAILTVKNVALRGVKCEPGPGSGAKTLPSDPIKCQERPGA